IPIDGGDSSIFDVLRRGEVRLARSEVHHVDSLAAQLVGFGYHRHGGGRLDAVDAFGQLDRGRHVGGRWSHDFFLALDFRLSDFSSGTANSASLYAGSSFPFTFCSTSSGTRPLIDPPSCATSRTNRELRYEYFSAGIMKTVSSSGRSFRFINAICNSYS